MDGSGNPYIAETNLEKLTKYHWNVSFVSLADPDNFYQHCYFIIYVQFIQYHRVYYDSFVWIDFRKNMFDNVRSHIFH